MNKSTLPVGIKTMIGWKNKGTLTFDNPIQRSGSQWTLLQKSLLIHSILMGYPIPNCYFLKTKDENGNTVYDCLDATITTQASYQQQQTSASMQEQSMQVRHFIIHL